MIKNFKVDVLKKGFKSKGDQKGGPLFSPYRVTAVIVHRIHVQNLRPDHAEVMIHTHACSFHGLPQPVVFVFAFVLR